MLVQFMVQEHGVSQRQACNALGVPRSSYQYKPKPRNDIPIIENLEALVAKHPAIGFWQSFFRLRRQGRTWNHKRVYRVYTSLHLNIRRRFKKRLPARVKQALFQPHTFNEVWSVDFLSDSLWDGRKFRLLNIVDDFNRQVLALEADISLPALRVIRVLEYLKEFRGLPKMIRVDNGPEFISHVLDEWCRRNGIILSSRVSPHKMRMWSGAMAASEKSSLTPTCFIHYVRCERKLKSGCSTTIMIGPTNPWDIERLSTTNSSVVKQFQSLKATIS